MYRENFENITLFKKEYLTVSRITALWAFSEAALGGILHALRIPLTGLFIGGSAIIFLTLIAHFAEHKSQIIQSTIIVILVKGIVSPHTPLNAYFAVFLQGFIAYLFFTLIPHKKSAAFLLGISVLTLAAFQKLFVLTVVFGNTLWNSIDTFGQYLIDQFMLGNLVDGSFQLSYLLIGLYAGIHIIGGIIFGILAGNTPKWISKNSFRADEYNDLVLKKENGIEAIQKRKKKKGWWKRKSGLALILFSILMILIVYFNPQFDDNLILSILVMFVRSIAVTIIWFGLLSPIVIKFIKKYLAKKKSQHTKEIDEILSLFPFFKRILNYSWHKTKEKKNYQRIIPFMKNTFVLLLLAEIETNE